MKSVVIKNTGHIGIDSIVKYGGWLFAVIAFGWTASSMIGNKVGKNDLKELQILVEESKNINGQQDVEIKNIYNSLGRIEGKLDAVLEIKND